MDERSFNPVPALKDRSLLTDKAYFAGRWISVDCGKSIAVTDPFDGSIIADIPDLGVEAVRDAIDAAAIAQVDWAKRSAKARSVVLKRWYDLIIENADDLAQILTAEQGKPLAEAKGEIVSNAAYLEWFAEEAKRIDGDIIPAPNAHQRIMVLKQPVGVCAAITPWNFPNGMITRKAGPALAAGCTMILKPASQTPLSALALAVLAERAGVPAGSLLGRHGRGPADRPRVLSQPESREDHLHRIDSRRPLADEGGGGRHQAAVARTRRQCTLNCLR